MDVKNLKLIAKTEEDLRVVSAHLQDSIASISDIANLKDYDFNVRKALDSKKGRETTKWIRDNKCSCSFECAASCNVAFSKVEALKALKLRLLNE